MPMALYSRVGNDKSMAGAGGCRLAAAWLENRVAAGCGLIRRRIRQYSAAINIGVPAAARLSSGGGGGNNQVAWLWLSL